MKTEEIPFSLEEYNKGGYQVVDGAKRNIRIVCTDQQDSTYPIVGLVSVSKHSEHIRTYTESGIYILEYPDDKEMNLMLVKTEFEKGDFVKCCDDVFIVYKEIEDYILSVEAKKYSIISCRPTTKEEISEYLDRTADKICNAQKGFDSIAYKLKYYLAENTKYFDPEEIKEFYPTQVVLMCNAGAEWTLCHYSHQNNSKPFSFRAMGGRHYEYCLPYNNETKHLLGQTFINDEIQRS